MLNKKADFELFIDVYRCRLEGFLPLPQIVKRNEVWVVADEHNPYMADEMPPMPMPAPERAETPKPTKQVLWERKLLDFTMRNTLLNAKMK